MSAQIALRLILNFNSNAHEYMSITNTKMNTITSTIKNDLSNDIHIYWVTMQEIIVIKAGKYWKKMCLFGIL